MRIFRLYALLVLFVFLTPSFFAYALTAKNNLTISVVVPPKVQLSTTTMNFGSVFNTTNTTTRTTATITVNMVATQAYQITLNAGQHATTTRRMRNAAGAFVAYSLYQNPANTVPWGDNGYGNTFAAGNALITTGTGNNQVFTVYGKMQTQATQASGSFTDTITVTVHY